MKKLYIILVAGLLAFKPYELFNNTPQTLPFTQDWSNAALITANDNWSTVAGIEGYLGQDITTTTGTNPQSLLTTSGVANDLDVIANQSNPGTLANGGVAEFDGIANPCIGLQGSGTADAPHIIINLNTTGLSNVAVAYNVRDLDASADDAVQQVAVQYRVGNSGNFANLPLGYIADATTVNTATQVTARNVVLPAGCDNQALVQVRVITTNAAGNDEWVGIDDINVTGTPVGSNSAASVIGLMGPITPLSNIPYQDYQATDVTAANGAEIAQFVIRDGFLIGGGDPDILSTTLTSITFGVANYDNIRRIAIYSLGTEVGEADGAASVTFSGLNISAPDGGSRSFSVFVTFKDVVTDNQQIVLTVTNATADPTGSTFAAANAGGAVSTAAGDDNRIEVTADRLRFVQNVNAPATVNVAITPAPTVETIDALGNRDLDVTRQIIIRPVGGTNLQPEINVSAVAGLATFNTIVYDEPWLNARLDAKTFGIDALTPTQSNFFDIVGPPPTVTLTPFVGTPFFTTSGVPSAEQSFTVSGTALVSDITLGHGLLGYEMSTGSGASFVPTNPITLPRVGQTVPPTTIYVRVNSTTLGTIRSAILSLCPGAANQL
jgi:hypothetical protein